MFNLLVTGAADAWDLPAYEFDRTRFLEHTVESLRARFRILDAKNLEELKSLPTLFAYEGDDGPVRVGYIRRIREHGRSILIEYEFDESIPTFSYAQLKPLAVKLDINIWEMCRTHWAVKDEDLFELLASIDIVDVSYVGEGRPTGRVEETRFRVAFSFPGEKRRYVEDVVTEVKKCLGRDSVFYDKDYTAQLARPNLDLLLQRIYLNNSDLVVVFLCAEYEIKEWCGLEWRAIRNIIKNRNDHAIMFVRFDNAHVEGIFSNDGYVNLEEYTPLETARMIVERVRLNGLSHLD